MANILPFHDSDDTARTAPPTPGTPNPPAFLRTVLMHLIDDLQVIIFTHPTALLAIARFTELISGRDHE